MPVMPAKSLPFLTAAGPLPPAALAEALQTSCIALAFAPDGKWLAVLTQVSPPGRSRGEVDVREVPQPLVRLIDVAAGKIRETLVCPTGYAGSACFSRDGKTLGTSVSGRVLLWDLTKPPLEAH